MSQESLDRLKRLSRTLYGFSVALIVVLLVAGVVLTVMVAVDTTVVSQLYPGIARDPALVSAPAGFASLALGWITLGLMVYAIVCLMRMFALFGGGRVFDPQGRILDAPGGRHVARAGGLVHRLAHADNPAPVAGQSGRRTATVGRPGRHRNSCRSSLPAFSCWSPTRLCSAARSSAKTGASSDDGDHRPIST